MHARQDPAGELTVVRVQGADAKQHRGDQADDERNGEGSSRRWAGTVEWLGLLGVFGRVEGVR